MIVATWSACVAATLGLALLSSCVTDPMPQRPPTPLESDAIECRGLAIFACGKSLSCRGATERRCLGILGWRKRGERWVNVERDCRADR